MTTVPAIEPAPASRSWSRGLGRQVAVSVAVCLGIAVVLTAAMPMATPMPVSHAFLRHWLYAQCIGGCIQALIEGGRMLIAARLRARRPGDASLASGWPGWRWFLPWLLVASVSGYLLGASLADSLLSGSHVRDLLGGDLRPLVFLAVLTLGVSLLTSHAFYTRSRLETAEARAAAVAREAAEHQLRLLEAQLEPHMLFNTLANLRVLIGLDPPRAQAMLDHLIAFLRATLRASQERLHPLATEFDRLGDYLALMQVRMGPRLTVSLDLPDALRDAAVPPLLLQPLVENAIRHGLEPQVAGGRLAVSARCDGAVLELAVTDDGAGLPPSAAASAGAHADPRPPSPDGGFGLRQVRQRLATMYGAEATLVLAPGPSGVGTEARIRLPLAAVAAAEDLGPAARPSPGPGTAGAPDAPAMPSTARPNPSR